MNAARIRRRFLARPAAVVSAAPALLRAGGSPNNRLNLAIIGVGGRGRVNLNGVKARPGGGLVQTDLGGVRGENVAALCDVDEVTLAKAAREFPGARTYVDWRRCLDQRDLDAVVCSTPDHTHAFICVWVMNRGLSVYCEKPLAVTVEEARVVRQTFLSQRGKIATQMGTQLHATDRFRRVVEMVRHGAIGAPREVRAWCGRRPEGGRYLAAAGAPPPTFHWDLWLGPSPFHPYNPGYLGGCLKWNRFWDFGGGQIADMGSHILDLAWWTLDLDAPAACRADGSPPEPDTCPRWLHAEWEHPANDWRPAVKVHWYDGGKRPGLPSAVFRQVQDAPVSASGVRPADPDDVLFKGVLFAGDEGWLITDCNFRVLFPRTGRSDLSYYRAPRPADLIPSSPGHHEEWIEACKTGKPTGSNFDYAGRFIEHNLLALVAYRVGRSIRWDAAGLKAPDCPEADRFIRRTYREGWTLNG